MALAIEDAVLCKTFGLRGDIGSAEREPVYAFLLCARHRAGTSAPGPQKSRLRRSIRLSSLPREIIQHIARVLYVPQYVAEFDAFNDRKAAHVLSAFAVDDALILGHLEVDGKSNEIPAAQAMIKSLKLEGRLFTLDAMHCQKNIPVGA